MDKATRMEIIAANVDVNLSVGALMSLVDGHRSSIGGWIAEGDQWVIECGIKAKVSECLFNYGNSQYARAPQTITTKSVEIPKPISVLPDAGNLVFVSSPELGGMFNQRVITENPPEYQLELLKRGLLYLTAEEAIARSKADIEAAGGAWG